MEAARRVDPSRDTLLVAIARLGGINREEARREWGLRPEELRHRGLVGFPVFRKVGGKSIDEMRLALQELGYLSEDGDPNELEDKIALSLNGTPQYAAAGLEAQAEAEHDRRLENEQAAEQAEYVSNLPPELDDEEEARIEREAIQAESEAAAALDDLDDDLVVFLDEQISEDSDGAEQFDDEALDSSRADAEVLAGAGSPGEAVTEEAGGPDSGRGEEPGAREGLSPEESQTAAPDTEGESADPLAGIPGTGRIDLQLASRAHEGTSFDPEKRGAAWVREFEATVRADYESLRALAERHGKLDGLDERFARYPDGYATRITAYLASYSRVMSPMIVGAGALPDRAQPQADRGGGQSAARGVRVPRPHADPDATRHHRQAVNFRR